jgi:hypothetical protein
MAKRGMTRSAARTITIGEVEDLLNGAYKKLSIALRNPPAGQLQTIVDTLNLIEWVLNQIIIQGLHRDAQILAKLSAQLKNATDQLVQLKNNLTQLAQVAALGASLLNTIGSILPLL